MANEGDGGSASARGSESGKSGEAGDVPASGGQEGLRPATATRTPLFQAKQSDRYARQDLIRGYEDLTSATLIVVIDQIFPENVTYLEELLFDTGPNQPLHLLLASPGGDGETAIRMVRSIQARCAELTVIVPDMAKSAATLMCLGADHILMGPGGDLGPVDPQFPLGQNLVSAKEIVAAVDEAERRIKEAPDTFPLFASLLSDVNLLMVQQARSAINRSGALVREALGCAGRREEDVPKLADALAKPLIEEPASHSAVISAEDAKAVGLPVTVADPRSPEWVYIWNLWTRYFTLGCFPRGPVAIYEGRRASHIIRPGSLD